MVRAGHSSARAQLIYQHSRKRHQRKIASAMDADVRRQREEVTGRGGQAEELATAHRLVVRDGASQVPEEVADVAEQ